jgi:hypothetical protein
VARGRFAPQALHEYTRSVDAAIEQIGSTGFWEWDDIGYHSDVEGGREFLYTQGTVLCAGGIRVQVSEKLQFHRQTRWTPRGANRLLVLTEYSNSAVLHNRGTIFRYDSPDPEPAKETPEHHRYHHVHRFDVLGTGAQIMPPARVAEWEVPTLRQVLQEAERWHYGHPNRS